jgi:two-component system, NarL family, response regulator LiaR
MKKKIIIYGLIMAVLIYFLKIIEYKFFVRDLSVEFYITLISLLFTFVGIFLGLQIVNKRKRIDKDFSLRKSPEEFGISKREFDVLNLMIKGLSNQEIADQLFVSLSTIKSHISSIFQKLNVSNLSST